MFEFLLGASVYLAIVVVIWIVTPPREVKIKEGKERVSTYTHVEIDGYCATGDPRKVDQLFPAAKARLETTMSDDIVYLGVNPLTQGSQLSGMYIDLEELYAAVKQLRDRNHNKT